MAPHLDRYGGAPYNVGMEEPGKIVFVYNAQSGAFHALADLTHKLISPQTYACNLCAVTYSPWGMKRRWRRFLTELGAEYEFLHKDEFQQRYGSMADLPLPAILRESGGQLRPWIDQDALESVSSVEDLENLLRTKLQQGSDC